jgi:serine/threonine protein kinase
VVDHTAKALTKVHAAGLVHRDLKPHNLFLTSDENGLLVKLLDFGVTKTLADSSSTALTRTGLLVGTLHYMSPEQAESQPVDSRSDIWTLGVIAFECLTGRVPFDETTVEGLLDAICSSPIVVPSTLARVPAGFDDWFTRAVERDRKLRFQTARQLADALQPLLASDDSSWVGEWSPDTLPNREAATVHLHTYPSGGPDRRGELRRPSMIPAGIDRRRDLRHTALIFNWSRTGALLLTRHPCQLDQELLLTLHVENPDHGETVTAVVVRISPRNDPIWTLEVGVRFDRPLSDSVLLRLERRGPPADGLPT